LLLLAIGDCVTTYKGLSRGAVEQNKIAAWFFKKIGVLPSMVLVKSAVLAPMGYLLKTHPEHWMTLTASGLLTLGSIYVLYSNIKTLKKL
jgi:xanthine/uracil permease